MVEPFSYDLEILTREHEQNKNDDTRAQFDWLLKRTQILIGLVNKCCNAS